MSLHKIDTATHESLYTRYNKREYVHPDPIEFLFDYKDLNDREIIALIASSLAYGRVEQILKSVSKVQKRLGSSPFSFLIKSKKSVICETFSDFKHRFTTCSDLSMLLLAAKRIVLKYGSLRKCFLNGLKDNDKTILPALSRFVSEFKKDNDIRMLPSPDDGSACKRLNLFLRWMVRSDEVDPGGWPQVPKSKLIVPLDTHMHRIALKFRLTKRRQANLQTALEITEAFARFSPDDPVKYDFALTRFGINRNFPSLCKEGVPARQTSRSNVGGMGVDQNLPPTPSYKGGKYSKGGMSWKIKCFATSVNKQ